MGWGWIRIGIVSIAFFVGLLLSGPIGTSAGSKPPDILRVNEHIGASLIIACDGGDVAVKYVGGAVQLECAKGKIVVVRDRKEQKNPLPLGEGRVRVSRFD
jgi:hypothetical protein